MIVESACSTVRPTVAAVLAASYNCKREDAHSHQIASVNSLEAFGDDRFHTQQVDVPLAAQSRAAAHAIIFAGQHDQRDVPSFHV